MGSIDGLLLSILLGYLLGSIPVASLVSRRRGVNIFSTGTGLPGAANVFRNVGHKTGVLVSAGDVAKGALVIIAAMRLGVEGALVLLPAFAAIAGHWRSIFTGFRGGDGLVTLVGITLLLVPTYTPLAVTVGFAVGLWYRHTSHPSLLGGVVCNSLLLAQAVLYSEQVVVTLGIAMLSLMVLAHAVVGHRRRRPSLSDNDVGEDLRSPPSL